MKNPRVFWGILVIAAGLIFLASSFGLFSPKLAWNLVWPISLVMVGFWIILNATIWRKRAIAVENFSIDKADIQTAMIELHHGAGSLVVGPTDNPSVLLDGSCSGGVDQRTAIHEGHAHIELHPKQLEYWDGGWAFGSRGLDWKIGLNPQTPTDLTVKYGANQAVFDLSTLNIEKLKIEAGATDTRINLPEQGKQMKVKIAAGAASIVMKIPSSLEAQLHFNSGVSTRKLDEKRFKPNGSVFETAGYLTAEHKAEIYFETGLTSVEII